jgi:hexosaminidase
MTPEQRALVLGSQGQLWTEYMADMSTVEYMGFPRICALAEVLWLDAEKKDYADFLARLRLHRDRLAVMGVNAHPQP